MYIRRCVYLVVVSCLFSSSVCAATPYDDVPKDHWSYDAVEQLTKDGVLEGYPDGTFRGEEPLTRFEMAKAVKRAMDNEAFARKEDRALLDKLAREYSEELKGFGMRVIELERRVGNIHWGGSLRYRYLTEKRPGAGGGGFMAMFGGGNNPLKRSHLSYMTARLEPDIKISKNWTGHMRLNYNLDLESGKNGSNGTFGGDDGGGGFMAMFGGGGGSGRKVREFSVDRLWLQGDYPNLQVMLGRFPYLSRADAGLVFDDNISGVQVTYGTKLKGVVTAGRVNSDPYSLNGSDSGMFSLFGNNDDAVTRTYLGAEAYYKVGKGSVGVGYHHFKDKDDNGGGGFMAMFGGGGNVKVDTANIISVGAGYQFDDKVGVKAAFAKNLKDDGEASSTRKAWTVEADIGKMDLQKAGNWSGFIAYRHYGDSAVWRPDFDVVGAGQKGWEFGVNYILGKNVRATLKYFRGKMVKDGTKADSLLGEVVCYF